MKSCYSIVWCLNNPPQARAEIAVKHVAPVVGLNNSFNIVEIMTKDKVGDNDKL
jgi:recombinational DNA repair protein RecT